MPQFTWQEVQAIAVSGTLRLLAHPTLMSMVMNPQERAVVQGFLTAIQKDDGTICGKVAPLVNFPLSHKEGVEIMPPKKDTKSKPESKTDSKSGEGSIDYQKLLAAAKKLMEDVPVLIPVFAKIIADLTAALGGNQAKEAAQCVNCDDDTADCCGEVVESACETLCKAVEMHHRCCECPPCPPDPCEASLKPCH